MNYRNLNICIIGVGKVGSAFAIELNEAGFKVKYLIEKNKTILQKISKTLKGKILKTKIDKEVITNSDVIIIAVKDSQIADTVKEIRVLNQDLKNKIIFHTSGLYTSELLKKLKIKENNTGSFHPVQTFSGISLNNGNLLRNIYFGIEGGKSAQLLFRSISRKLNSHYLVIPSKNKILYHIACVIASNFLVTQQYILNSILKSINVKKSSYSVFEPIIKKTLFNISKNGYINALTGPIERNDFDAFSSHLKSIKKMNIKLLKYYSIISENTLKVALDKGSLNKKDEKQYLKLIKKYK